MLRHHLSLHCFGKHVFLAILLGIFAGFSFAQKAADTQDLTADELVVNASSCYAQGEFAEALALYRRFFADLVPQPEAQATVRDVHYTLAICLLSLQRFVEAHQAIGEALENNPPIKDHMPKSCCFGRVLARCRKRMANKPG